MRFLIQLFEERKRVALFHGNFVAYSPTYDTRVVVILYYQFFQLEQGVAVAPVVSAYKRNLRPHAQTLFVRKVVYRPSVLVVGKPQGVRAYLFNKLEVLPTLFVMHRPAVARAVLVHSHAAERYSFPVQGKAVFVGSRPTNAEFNNSLVPLAYTVGYCKARFVHQRSLFALP